MHPGSPTSFESGPSAASDPRRLILTAMTRVAGTEGYRAATIAGVLAEAGVSQVTFHQHFAGFHDCFLAAYETVLDGLRDEVFGGCDAGRAWAGRRRSSRRSPAARPCPSTSTRSAVSASSSTVAATTTASCPARSP